jgi:hypothetical protein
LKDAAMEYATGGAAPSSGGSSGGSTQSAEAYALQNWPNYLSWESLPQYLKDAAPAATQ